MIITFWLYTNAFPFEKRLIYSNLCWALPTWLLKKNISQRLSAMRTTWYRMQSFAMKGEYKPSRFSIVPPCWWLVGWSRREEMWWNVRDMGVDNIRTLKNMRVYFTGFNCVSDLMINKPSRSQYQGIWHWTCMTGSSWTGGWGRFDQISNGRCDVIPCAYGLFLEQLFCNYSEVNQ